MNIIINGFHHKILFPILTEIIQIFNVKYCHITYTKSKLSTPTQTKIIFHNVMQIVRGEYDIDNNNLIPLEEKLIYKMNHCEVQALRMMDRHTLSYETPLTYGERKILYLKHLRYWNHLLETRNIHLYLSSSPPHEVYDYILFSLCKLKKIPTIFLYQTCISDTLIMLEDLEYCSLSIQKKYQDLLSKHVSLKGDQIHLDGRFKRDFEKNVGQASPNRFEMLRSKPSVSIVKNILPLLSSFSSKRLVTIVKHPKLLLNSLINNSNIFFNLEKSKELHKFYCANLTEPNFKHKYLYYPLHLQPEASTSPMAGAYVDQLLIVQMVSKYLPKDVYIYIKENPHQELARRDKDFYEQLLKIKQVRLVSTLFDTYTLTNNSLAVITATGTVGLEALYRCKPVLMFGHNFYQYSKGVFQINNIQDCKKSLKKIILEKYKPSIKEIMLYLVALKDFTIEGHIDLDYKKDTYISDKISNQNITLALITKIKQTIKP